MDDLFPSAILVIAAFVLALRALFVSRGFRDRIGGIDQGFAQLEQRVAALADRVEGGAFALREVASEAERPEPEAPEPAEVPTEAAAPPVESVAEPPVAAQEAEPPPTPRAS